VGGCFRRDSNLERIGIFEIQRFSKFLLCSSEIILLDDFFESASAEILSNSLSLKFRDPLNKILESHNSEILCICLSVCNFFRDPQIL
jgi:hypothetical protein